MNNTLSPVHPGYYLRETLEEMHITARKFAHHIGISPMRISLVLRGIRPVNADLALRLEKALGQSAGYWMNLQAKYDLDTAVEAGSTCFAKIQLVSPLTMETLSGTH
ncbi:HigA family addiction module antitoxin [Chrysiogenes arsenatis]|uniref:HigA family addiction module antitoxin n=1 Tax=Chrysiogenes arsenatis TaxID=309797 RepID=UPI00041B08B6|nr:HigA family addiction module antitoxin [Chrysiogenes arsenatis]